MTPVPLSPSPTSVTSQGTMKQGVRFSMAVTVVALAICYVYFTTIFIYIDRWFGLLSSPGIINAVTYMPNIEDSESPVHEIKRKVSWFINFWSTNIIYMILYVLNLSFFFLFKFVCFGL